MPKRRKHKKKKPVTWYSFTCDECPDKTLLGLRYHVRIRSGRYHVVAENLSEESLIVLKLKYNNVTTCPWSWFKNIRDLYQ